VAASANRRDWVLHTLLCAEDAERFIQPLGEQSKRAISAHPDPQH
jgi:hypothetical protein